MLISWLGSNFLYELKNMSDVVKLVLVRNASPRTLVLDNLKSSEDFPTLVLFSQMEKFQLSKQRNFTVTIGFAKPSDR